MKQDAHIPFKIENFTAMANFNAELDLKTIFCGIQNSQMKTMNTCVQFNLHNGAAQASLY